MDKNIDNGKYLLKSELRTWSELKKQRALEAAKDAAAVGNNSRDASTQSQPIDPKRRNTLSQFLPSAQQTSTPAPPRKWGGCVAGCDHKHDRYPRRRLQAQPPSVPEQKPPQEQEEKREQYAGEDHPIAHQEDATSKPTEPPGTATLPIRPSKTPTQMIAEQIATENGSGTPHEEPSDNEFDYFDPASTLPAAKGTTKRAPKRRPTEEDLERWASESGMGSGKRADALGDEPDEGDEEGEESTLEEQEKKDRSLKGSVY